MISVNTVTGLHWPYHTLRYWVADLLPKFAPLQISKQFGTVFIGFIFDNIVRVHNEINVDHLTRDSKLNEAYASDPQVLRDVTLKMGIVIVAANGTNWAIGSIIMDLDAAIFAGASKISKPVSFIYLFFTGANVDVE